MNLLYAETTTDPEYFNENFAWYILNQFNKNFVWTDVNENKWNKNIRINFMEPINDITVKNKLFDKIMLMDAPTIISSFYFNVAVRSFQTIRYKYML